jgi:hypothetical protein
MLSEGRTHEMLLNGFSAAMRFRLELWRSGNFFDQLDSAVTWTVLVRFDPYAKTYQIVRRGARATEVSDAYRDRESAEAALDSATLVSLPPKRQGEVHYYNVVVDVATLEFSDLDELQRWLRGDLEPAARGKVNPVSALRRGIGSLLSRMLGGERRHYEARSVTFRN